ncbi:LacI family DNA-binding transcriptional regulator [Boudabousia marimammalium]|uniref:HTH lacI-type domain-containing protein n=1 Tax=Boudabousia marimammalium TaxID=156892 RepID=A0A1Q5PL21_9ACTO|nr:LacI family DNA-binding transcriptional regulator [Boudabousia marimammalium]OKL47339.1 hypothetical protein BM477_06630 [Boudabousia marimammalium]
MAATIRDIASACNVSLSTVSRALNEQAGVSEETRVLVQETAARLGYLPNVAAQRLRRRGSDLIGIFIKGPMNPFFQELLERFEHRLRAEGFVVSIVRIWHNEDEVAITQATLASTRYAGAIMLGGWFNVGAEGLAQVSVPTVFCTTYSVAGADLDKYSTVVIDDRQAMRDLVTHLRGLGHERIAYLGCDDDDLSVGSFRESAFQEALQASGVPLVQDLCAGERFEEDPYSFSYGYRFAQKLASHAPTAVVAVSDVVALGAVRGLTDLGLRVPEDVSVAGIDGILVTEFTVPRLTTVVQPAEELVSETWDLLRSLMSGGEHRHVIVPGVLSARESTGPVAS